MPAMADRIAQLQGYVEAEREAALLYRRLAEQVEGRERRVLERLAEGEERHAAFWARALAREGGDTPSGRVRLGFTAWLALSLGRRFGLAGAMPVLERHEGREMRAYSDDPAAPDALLRDEAEHAEMVQSLAPSWRRDVAGPLRAGIFGFSDGVVSNLSLVIGVFGAGVDNDAVVTAGVAGLIAGATSMAVGEYVSVASQQEVLAVGVEALDQAHAEEASPASSEAPTDASTEAWRAAVASFTTFAVGALVPLLPFLMASGTGAALAALLATGAVLYAVGAALSLLTMRSSVRSGLRQLLLGWAAAAVTYGVGLAIGGTVVG